MDHHPEAPRAPSDRSRIAPLDLFEGQPGVNSRRAFAHFTYDRLAGLLEQFDNEDVRAVAGILDQRMETLATRLARWNHGRPSRGDAM